MVEVFNSPIEGAAEVIKDFSSFFSNEQSLIFAVLTKIIILTLVSFFIWSFYKSISKKNIIKLNLNQYNIFTHHIAYKILAILFYLLEYILIIPFIILVWFSSLAIVLILISERSPHQILVITAALIATTRILAYYKVRLSEEIAKLFPLVAMSLFLLSPSAFNVQTVTVKLYQIPSLLPAVIYTFIAVVVIEIILRLIYTLYAFFKSEDEAEKTS